MSHPMWVRGLKQLITDLCRCSGKSHPMWVRGLKRSKYGYDIGGIVVAPHVGAWIETYNSTSSYKFICVAPHVGAWIETDTRA